MCKTNALRRFFSKCLAAIALITLILNFIVGCSKKPEKSPPKNATKTEQEPKILKDLATSVEVIIKDFEKTFINQTAPPEPSASKKTEENKKTKGSTKDQEQGKNSKTEEKPKKEGNTHNWNKAEKDISKIHQLWNEFRADAIKYGISSDVIESFSDNLNELTTTLTKRELFRGLILSNDLYDKVVSFEKFFKNKSADLKSVLHLGRDATYKALYGMTEEALNSIQKSINIWNTAKAQVEDTAMISKLEHSLKELSIAIKKQDPNLIKIKAKIGEKNLEQVIKVVEKNK